ncbi:hypothetical protein PybrP1_011908 [[Pythium] brassicae (nom. inval.)]|nr:hypothetical protein PybrP1_011908 [[Pythium] brassicae (nom. inval.)]
MKRGRNALCDEDDVFAKLFGSLDAAFERLDEVMESSGLASVTSDRSRSCQSKTFTSADGVAIPSIELTDTTVGTFPTWLVAKAGWEVVLQGFVQRSSDSVGPVKVWYAGDTIALTAQTRCKLRRQGGNGAVPELEAYLSGARPTRPTAA